MNLFNVKHVFGIFLLVASVIFASYGVVIFMADDTEYEKAGPYNYTTVRGLDPGSQIEYSIAYKQNFLDHYDGNLKEEIGGTVTVAADGSAELPQMQAYYQRYDLFFDATNNKASLRISQNDKTDRLDIKGKGFEIFSDVFINEGAGGKTLKTDWAGLFSESVLLPDAENNNGEAIKLAFGGFTIDGIENPAAIEVVIGVGGGPWGVDTNVYDEPNRIHEYNCDKPQSSSDGDDVFYVSTCDESRMDTHIEGTGTGTLTFNIVQPLMMMTEQLSAVMMQQMQILGSFLDAKEQQEAQRDMRHLVAQAHKDYHPSEQMCRFGSYIRSMSDAEERGEFNKQALNKMLTDHYNYREHMSSSEGYDLEIEARLDQFKRVYCDPNDNSGSLWEMCRGQTNDPATNPSPSGTPGERNRYNKDIDFFSTLYRPLTLDIDFYDPDYTEDEEDVIALAKNLYWPQAKNIAGMGFYEEDFNQTYRVFLETRSLTSKYNLAHNTFATIVGMKSASDDTLPTAGPAYMKSLMRDFGYTNADIDELLGENPSYYAQMDFITKKIYQNPNFYTALYDKPSNVDRINATLEAFQLMHGRDRFEAQLRQEMLMSVLVEEALAKRVGEANAKILSISTRAMPLNPDGSP